MRSHPPAGQPATYSQRNIEKDMLQSQSWPQRVSTPRRGQQQGPISRDPSQEWGQGQGWQWGILPVSSRGWGSHPSRRTRSSALQKAVHILRKSHESSCSTWAETVRTQPLYWDWTARPKPAHSAAWPAPPDSSSLVGWVLGKKMPGGALLGNNPGVQKASQVLNHSREAGKAQARTWGRDGRAHPGRASSDVPLHVILPKG